LPIDDALIAAIRRRVERNAIAPALRPGEVVSIDQGPFKGLDAIFKAYQDEQRVLLLIELLHRQLTVSAPVSDVRRSA
jgi:transcriptional antiterminator RfaH